MFDMLTSPYTHPLKKLIWMRMKAGARAVWETISGNPVSFTAKAAPLRKLEVAFSPVQTGTGDPSPDNVRPILGWDSLNVEQTGKNLWDGEWEYGNISDSTGQNSGTSSSYFRSKNYIPINGAMNYYPHNSYRSANYRQYYYDKNYTYLGYTGLAWNVVKDVRSLEYADQIAYMRFRVSGAHSDEDDISLNYPSTDHVYHPYNPSSRSISITLGEIVYSGYVDVVTGVVKARPYYASYNGETLVGPWMSSMDKYVAGATPTVGAQVVDLGGAETTIQLTPQEVSSLLEENNMWSDANGNLTVTFSSSADPATTPIVGKGKVGQAIIGG